MPAYPRHHHGEMPQGSGGYDAVAIPRAPRTPQFVPQMVSASGPYHAATASSRVPAAAHSLSPVAMASARGAVATGPYAAQDSGAKARPTAKAGFAILLAGAIIGGLIGAVTHAREGADAFAAAAAKSEMRVDHDANGKNNDDAPPPGAVAPLPNSGAPGVLPNLAPGASDSKGGLLAGADAKAADKADKAEKKTTKGGGGFVAPKRGGGGGASANSGVDKGAEAAIANEDKPAKTSKKGKKGGDDDDGYTVASSGGGDKAEKTETPKAEKKKAAGGDDDEKPTKKKGGKKSGGGDAESVLRAAMNATDNSL